MKGLQQAPRFLLTKISFFVFIRGKKEALPEQKNDGVPDFQAAERAWNAEKLIDKSFIRETFYGQWRSVLSK